MGEPAESASKRVGRFPGKWMAVLLWVGSLTALLAQGPSPEMVEQGRFGVVPGLDAPFLTFRQSREVGTLEVVQRVPAPDMFTIYVSQTYFHTDNLFLISPNPQSADAWISGFGVSFVPYSTYRWTPRLTMEGALARFDSVSSADYNTQAISFDNRIGLSDDNLLSWNFSASALRSESEDTNPGEFYKRVEIVNNLNWFLQLDHAGHWALHVSPGLVWRIAHPSFEDRFDAGAVASVLWLPNRMLAVEPFFEGGYGYFPNDSPTLLDRRDVHLRGGVNVLWQINDRMSVVASACWVGNYSSASDADYQILPYVTLNVRFAF